MGNLTPPFLRCLSLVTLEQEGTFNPVMYKKMLGTVQWWQWWRTPLIPTLGRQIQVDLSEFKASLLYRVRSKTVRPVTQRNPLERRKENAWQTLINTTDCSNLLTSVFVTLCGRHHHLHFTGGNPLSGNLVTCTR